VLAVGGTSLNGFDEKNGRLETSWSHTGGGISRFVNLPDYQNPAYSNNKLQVLSNATKRNVADVAFNADPDTGQYVATFANGKVTWRRFGGTSIAAPQWAGITAITNATRALNGQGPIGLVQNLLYKAAGSVSDFFSSVVNDVQTPGVDQNNNTKLTVSAYYDLATGLGTPNVKSFMTLAGGDGSNSAQSPVPPSPVKPSPPVDKPISSAPVVSDVSLDGIAGSSLAFSLSLSAPNPVTWTLSDAPSGMQIDNSGLVKWPEPIAGKYTAFAVATDNVTGLIGKGKVSLNISPANNAVQMEPINIAGQEGKLLIFKVRAQPAYSLSFALDKNAPAGLSLIAHSGTMIWQKPVAGTYDFKIIATDKKTLATTSADVHVQINTASLGPQFTVNPIINGKSDWPLNAVIGLTYPGQGSLRVNISGAPAGMSFSAIGGGILVRWRYPVTGSYTLLITATANNDQKLSSQVSVPVTIN
jgi:hypothetical protein